MANKEFIIERTQPTIYQDNRGKVIEGFRVDVLFPEFNEGHSLNVATMDPEKVKVAVLDLLTKRRKIAELGG